MSRAPPGPAAVPSRNARATRAESSGPTLGATTRARRGRPWPSSSEGEGAAHHGLPPLELVHGEEDAFPVEGVEGGLDPLAPDESLEVAELAPRLEKEGPVRARPVPVDRGPDQREDGRLALGEAAAQVAARRVDLEGPPEVGGKAAGEAAAGRGVLARARHAATPRARRHRRPRAGARSRRAAP
jgi:hypothetical protein